MAPYRRTRGHALAESTNKIASIANAINGGANQTTAAPTPDKPHTKWKDVSPHVRVEVAFAYYRHCGSGKHRVARNLMPSLLQELEKYNVHYRTGEWHKLFRPNVNTLMTRIVVCIRAQC